MKFTERCWPIFEQVISDYHKSDHVDTPIANPYPEQGIERDLYRKCWIDTVQWHLEDLIRDPQIDPLRPCCSSAASTRATRTVRTW